MQTVDIFNLKAYLTPNDDYCVNFFEIKEGYTGFLKNHLIEHVMIEDDVISIYAYEFRNTFKIVDGKFSGEEYEGHFLKIIKNEILVENSVV